MAAPTHIPGQSWPKCHLSESCILPAGHGDAEECSETLLPIHYELAYSVLESAVMQLVRVKDHGGALVLGRTLAILRRMAPK